MNNYIMDDMRSLQYKFDLLTSNVANVNHIPPAPSHVLAEWRTRANDFKLDLNAFLDRVEDMMKHGSL